MAIIHNIFPRTRINFMHTALLSILCTVHYLSILGTLCIVYLFYAFSALFIYSMHCLDHLSILCSLHHLSILCSLHFLSILCTLCIIYLFHESSALFIYSMNLLHYLNEGFITRLVCSFYFSLLGAMVTFILVSISVTSGTWTRVL